MALTSHDVLARVHVPDLPRAIVGSRGHNLLPLVERHTSDASGVRRDLVGSGQTVGQWLVGLGEVGVGPSILRHPSVFGASFAQRALT